MENVNAAGFWIASIAVTTLLSLLLASVRGLGKDMKAFVAKTDSEIDNLKATTQRHEMTLFGPNGDNGHNSTLKAYGRRLESLERPA
jgi:hypothetical protein